MSRPNNLISYRIDPVEQDAIDAYRAANGIPGDISDSLLAKRVFLAGLAAEPDAAAVLVAAAQARVARAVEGLTRRWTGGDA